MWRFSIIGLLLALIATPDPLRGEGRSAILSPTDADPAQVDSGSFLRLTVRMLLPLTPPPGVQSDQVWKDWSAVLTRQAALSADGVSRRVVHQARIVRIRALDGVHLYSVLLRLSHWTPVGNYSVVLSGPGFQWTSSEAVRVGPQVVSVDMPGVNQTGEGEWLLQNRSGTEWRGVIDLVTGGDAGIQMIQPDGSVAQLVSATFARCTRNCSFRNARLLGFSVAIPPGESHIRVVRTALHSPLKVSIAHVTPEGSLEAIREHALRAVVSETPVSILWDFLDGDGGAGVEIRHRWTDSLSMRARIHGFDREGRVVSGCLARRMQVSHRSFSGFCSFQTTGRSAHSLLKLLLF